MKSRTSFFNKGILLNDFKRFTWIGIVYLLVLLFDVPLKIIMINNNNNNNEHYNESMEFIFNFDSSVQLFLIVVIPVIAAAALFRYLQSKKSVDTIHCLPIKRIKLYDNHIFTGIILLIAPVIITALTALILKGALNLNNLDIHYTVDAVLIWAGTIILFNTVIFLFSVLIGMITGLSTAQGILTYIFLFLPFGLGMLIVYNIHMFVYGLSGGYYFMANDLSKFSPLARLIELQGRNNLLNFTEVLVYLVLCIILYLMGRFVYNKRNLESAASAVAFNKLQPIFKYGVTFCCMLLGGFYFKETQNNIYWVFFGYIAASLIGYFVAEIIINKSLKVFKNIKGYFIFAGIITLVLLGINLDLIGYEKRIPALGTIENIYFSDYFYDYDLHYEDNNKLNFYFEKENLENIQKLHKKLIDDKDMLKYHLKYSNICLAYNLKNGKQIKRQYYISEDMYKEYLKPIYESLEYKKMHWDILNINHTSVDKIRISPDFSSKELSLTDPTDIKEAVEILKNEKLDETYEQMQDERAEWATIDILLNNDERVHFSWKKHHLEFEKWLTKKGYLKNARVMPKDIDYIVVEKKDKVNRSNDETAVEIETVKRLEIHDKEKIEICLRNYTWRHNGEYLIGFYTKDNDSYYESFAENYVPDFVAEYFK
jgi:ABC-2 type transport system permease protein